jgi:hypothetical protein
MTDEPVAGWLLEHLPDAPPPDLSHLPPPPAPQAPPPPVPAGWGTRLGCAVLELVLFVAALGFGWVVWWVALWPRGATPARSLLHLELVAADGSGRPRWPRSALRELAAKVLLPLAPISAVVCLAARRGLWERLTGTTVVAEP